MKTTVPDESTIHSAFKNILTKLKEKPLESLTDIFFHQKTDQETETLKFLLKENEVIIKKITSDNFNQTFKIEYFLKNFKQKTEKEAHDISFWTTLILHQEKWFLGNKTDYLKVKAKQENWRTIKGQRINFYFDYGIKKRTDEIMCTISEEELSKIETLFSHKISQPVTYFICDDLKSLNELGFKKSFSSFDSLISIHPCDLYEMTQFVIRQISSPPQFLLDGFSVYYAKFISKVSNDTLSFNASHIDRMAKEIIFQAPYPSIKTLLKNKNYYEAIHILYLYTLIFTSKNQKINYTLIFLAAPTSFIKFLSENDFPHLEPNKRIESIIQILKTNEPKETSKKFKLIFKISLRKAEKLWKKNLKQK